MTPGIKEYVDEKRNCEDIAMSLLVANTTSAPPLWVHSSRAIDYGKGLFKVRGISSSSGHRVARSECLNYFTKFYGGTLPLVSRPLSEHPHSWLLRLSPLADDIYAILHGRI